MMKLNLNVRSGEHFSLPALTCNSMAVRDHYLFLNLVGSFKDFLILTYELNPFKKLLIKESLLVSRDQLLLNKQVKPIPLQLL